MKSVVIMTLLFLSACVTSKERVPSSNEAQDWQQQHLRAIKYRR